MCSNMSLTHFSIHLTFTLQKYSIKRLAICQSISLITRLILYCQSRIMSGGIQGDPWLQSTLAVIAIITTREMYGRKLNICILFVYYPFSS